MTWQIPYEESALVVQIRRKNQTAFNALYDRYSPALYTIVLQIVQSRELANHLIKRVFQEIWQSFDQYDPAREKLFSWLLQVTRKVALEQLQSIKKNEEKEQPFSENGSSLVKDPAIDNCGLKVIINKLTNEQKILLDLYYYGGLKVDEIAQKAAIPEDQVKTTIRSALAELGTLLGK